MNLRAKFLNNRLVFSKKINGSLEYRQITMHMTLKPHLYQSLDVL